MIYDISADLNSARKAIKVTKCNKSQRINVDNQSLELKF